MFRVKDLFNNETDKAPQQQAGDNHPPPGDSLGVTHSGESDRTKLGRDEASDATD